MRETQMNLLWEIPIPIPIPIPKQTSTKVLNPIILQRVCKCNKPVLIF